MTLREQCKKYLTERGLWPDEADAVLRQAASDPLLDAMQGRWDEATEGYPPELFAALSIGLDELAVRWIDANKPRHFARWLFKSKE